MRPCTILMSALISHSCLMNVSCAGVRSCGFLSHHVPACRTDGVLNTPFATHAGALRVRRQAAAAATVRRTDGACEASPDSLGRGAQATRLRVSCSLSPALVQVCHVRVELAAATVLSSLRRGAGPDDPADGDMLNPEGPRHAIL
jgi:hypothetical protein